jgi:hypothetical protein
MAIDNNPNFWCMMEIDEPLGSYPEWELMIKTVKTLINYQAPTYQINKFVKGFPYKNNAYNYDMAVKYVKKWVYVPKETRTLKNKRVDKK